MGSAAVAIGALAFFGAPASASASVTLGTEQITLSSEGAGAIVTRSPFRVTFTGSGGEPVLSEAENVSGSTLPLSRSAIQPADAPTGPSTYSPLSFLVGEDQPEAY